jgi:hypothetical protein
MSEPVSDVLVQTFADLFNEGCKLGKSRLGYIEQAGLCYESNIWTYEIVGIPLQQAQMMCGSEYDLTISSKTWMIGCHAYPPRYSIAANDDSHWVMMGPFWSSTGVEGLYLIDFKITDPHQKMLHDLSILKLAL